MTRLRDRLEEVEERLHHKTNEGYVLMIMPDTTEDQAREQWERRTGKTVTEEEFRRILPDVGKIIVSIRTNEGTEECPWIRQYA